MGMHMNTTVDLLSCPQGRIREHRRCRFSGSKSQRTKGHSACMHSSPPPSSSSPPLPPSSPHCSALRAHTSLFAHANREEQHVERVQYLFYLSLPPPPPLLSLLKSQSEFLLLDCCKFLRIIVSMKGSNSERQFQQQYNNTGTPPLWAPILSSVTPLCPSDTSGVLLQSLHQHTHTCTAANMHTHSHTHTHNPAQTNPQIRTHAAQMELCCII